MNLQFISSLFCVGIAIAIGVFAILTTTTEVAIWSALIFVIVELHVIEGKMR